MQHSMVIWTKENHVFRRIFSALCNRNNVGNIACGHVPTTNNASLLAENLNKVPSQGLTILRRIPAFVVRVARTFHITRMPNGFAFPRTKSWVSLLRAIPRRIILKLLSANLTVCSFPFSVGWKSSVFVKALSGTSLPSPDVSRWTPELLATYSAFNSFKMFSPPFKVTFNRAKQIFVFLATLSLKGFAAVFAHASNFHPHTPNCVDESFNQKV